MATKKNTRTRARPRKVRRAPQLKPATLIPVPSHEELKPAVCPQVAVQPLPPVQRVRRSVQWPKDWWQAVKERFFPTWAKLEWPVEYQEQVWWETTTSGAMIQDVHVSQTGTAGIYTYTTSIEGAMAATKEVLREERSSVTPMQRGWDAGVAGLFYPERFGWKRWDVEALEYEIGFDRQRAGEPRPE